MPVGTKLNESPVCSSRTFWTPDPSRESAERTALLDILNRFATDIAPAAASVEPALTSVEPFGRATRRPRREGLAHTGWHDARTWGLSAVVDLRCAHEIGVGQEDSLDRYVDGVLGGVAPTGPLLDPGPRMQAHRDQDKGVAVIEDGAAGTEFSPDNGKTYFDEELI